MPLLKLLKEMKQDENPGLSAAKRLKAYAQRQPAEAILCDALSWVRILSGRPTHTTMRTPDVQPRSG